MKISYNLIKSSQELLIMAKNTQVAKTYVVWAADEKHEITKYSGHMNCEYTKANMLGTIRC